LNAMRLRSQKSLKSVFEFEFEFGLSERCVRMWARENL